MRSSSPARMRERNPKMGSIATSFVVYSTQRSVPRESPEDYWKAEDPWITIWVDELGRDFGQFSKQVGRLMRLVQHRNKCPIPSDGFDHMLNQQMREIERAFDSYRRCKEELLTYIKATAWHREPCAENTEQNSADRFLAALGNEAEFCDKLEQIDEHATNPDAK